MITDLYYTHPSIDGLRVKDWVKDLVKDLKVKLELIDPRGSYLYKRSDLDRCARKSRENPLGRYD